MMYNGGMAKKPLKVGFDLDGVILYNPARIVRPIVSHIKRTLFRKKTVRFYVPKTPMEQHIWHLFHKSSLFIAGGFPRIKSLAKEGKIEPYIVTARYNFLRHDFELWLKKMGARSYCAGCFHNEMDDQPHFYKAERMKMLKLDVFVEDNLDIAMHLKEQYPDKQVIWIYNILDKDKDFPVKFPNLNQALDYIENELMRK